MRGGSTQSTVFEFCGIPQYLRLYSEAVFTVHCVGTSERDSDLFYGSGVGMDEWSQLDGSMESTFLSQALCHRFVCLWELFQVATITLQA